MFGLAIIVLTRMVSLGSIMAAVLFPVLTLFIHEHYIVEGSYLAFSIIMAVIVIFNHRNNVRRILAGKENRIGDK